MIKSIYIYNHQVLRQKADDIMKDTDLTLLISDMLETMQGANGIGLAGPQIGLSQNIFVTASKQHPVFINPKILSEHGEYMSFAEGCLSIPKVCAPVLRKNKVAIAWFDADWNYHQEEFDKMLARIIQHEYDHLQGKLFTDHINIRNFPTLIPEMRKIKKGEYETFYPTVYKV